MKNKKRILLILSGFIIIVIIAFVINDSFSIFNYAKEGSENIIISTGGIEAEIISEESALNLENLYPVSDSEGLTGVPFIFSMTNTSSKSLNYTIRIESNTEKLAECKLDDGTSCSELSTNYIKFSYKKNDGKYSEPAILGKNDNIIASGTISGKEKITSSIILWIDSSATNEIMNQYFYGKVIVTGEVAD